jgi:hypothetical protein
MMQLQNDGSPLEGMKMSKVKTVSVDEQKKRLGICFALRFPSKKKKKKNP